jgi:hypothetical protein
VEEINMIVNVQAEVNTITSDRAAAILENQQFDRQRRLKPRAISQYKSAMKANEFLPGTQIIFAQLADQMILVDGQHRLYSQVSLNTDIDYMIAVYEVENKEDIENLYSKLDQGARRTMIDRLDALGVNEQFDKIPRMILTKLNQAAPYIENRFIDMKLKDFANYSPQKRIKIITSVEQGAIAWSEKLNEHNEPAIRKVLSRPIVTGLGVYTYQFAPDIADKFWVPIMKMATDSNDESGCPVRAAFKYLLNTEWRGAISKQISYIQTVIRCWNKAAENKKFVFKSENGRPKTLRPQNEIDIILSQTKPRSSVSNLIDKYPV